MKTYYGDNQSVGGQIITVMFDESDGKTSYPLPHIVRHSPDGFQWGYGGSGPADAALSILHDCVGEKDANNFYQEFKWDFIAGAGNKLKIKEEDIKSWLQKKKEIKLCH